MQHEIAPVTEVETDEGRWTKLPPGVHWICRSPQAKSAWLLFMGLLGLWSLELAHKERI